MCDENISGKTEPEVLNKKENTDIFEKPEPQLVQQMSIEEHCNALRRHIKTIEERVRRLMNDNRFSGEQTFQNQHSEMKANIMLTVRHLEDARMRVGKILQYADDGISILDKK